MTTATAQINTTSTKTEAKSPKINAFVMKGMHPAQVHFLNNLRSVDYLDGYFDAHGQIGGALTAGYTSGLLSKFGATFVTAGEVVATETIVAGTALAVAEGTIGAIMLTTVLPIVGGVAIGWCASYLFKEGFRWATSGIKEELVNKGVEAGVITPLLKPEDILAAEQANLLMTTDTFNPVLLRILERSNVLVVEKAKKDLEEATKAAAATPAAQQQQATQASVAGAEEIVAAATATAATVVEAGMKMAAEAGAGAADVQNFKQHTQAFNQTVSDVVDKLSSQGQAAWNQAVQAGQPGAPGNDGKSTGGQEGTGSNQG